MSAPTATCLPPKRLPSSAYSSTSTRSPQRAHNRTPAGRPPLGMGDALLYGEAVTSTQTMLDKNRHMLAALPTPLLSLASHQLAGRGRGTNVWLSPAGCLQFSLLLRAPCAVLPAARLVFVQYLAALAVVAACRAAPCSARTARASGSSGRTTSTRTAASSAACSSTRASWTGARTSSSVRGPPRVRTAAACSPCAGCGLNVLNAPPVASLVQLLPEGAGAGAAPSMERTMAAVMARFAPMWETFLAHGGAFAPFMDEYLETWLHSDQLVTLTTTTPPQKVRITGITEHGLLRTVPERDGWSGVSRPEFVDLQPDGNSFDMLNGLIKTKT
ncbi:hypothetical protein B0H21DRAFT_544431 [Amylocystis lapponica]|nr:hypothetical protein B0H21DRAFT_544431 [Amylocystis lapponica]